MRRDVRPHLERAPFPDDNTEPRDAAPIGLTEACGPIGGVFPDSDMEACRPRLKLLCEIGHIAREILGAISDIERGVTCIADAP
ncbi:MAG: hypothetical protein F4213_20810 [Boseongicola sp. SB0677_bin_26]|nr:hypothetical protein [Boseongicola sp. SB0677_bin_26]